MNTQQHYSSFALTAVASASGAVQIRFDDRVVRELTHVLERILNRLVPQDDALNCRMEKRVVVSTIFQAIECERIAPQLRSPTASKDVLLAISKALYANRVAYDGLYQAMTEGWQATCAKITAAVLSYFSRKPLPRKS